MSHDASEELQSACLVLFADQNNRESMQGDTVNVVFEYEQI